ncbi:acyclic terpene utilization AtuA family protein [Acidovorax sp.]|uniref:acyclic terpene utilization AtuA family protein n=1 Tax=Acidovorax sp. TaxID=1872122 RepID=UPI0027B9F50C|nr:acyclic terpene utilization AtuA family protein [Acidovorax sp.]
MKPGIKPKTLRIGSASGFWGDTEFAAAQLVQQGNIDVLVFDYLAEITMSLLSRAKAKDPAQGYAPDFVATLQPLMKELKSRGIKVIANAGGVNPSACRAALVAAAQAEGVDLAIAAVLGDDLMPQVEALRAAGTQEMFSGAPFPQKVMSANAYLGAFPIAAALQAGADIVVTGRCVDSAVTLAPLIHAFGWTADEYDRLALGSLAGHLIECGTQATGGNYTDWDTVPGWDDMGFPIAECRADGSFVVTKPEGTGGLVCPSTVGEQMLYEIGDPRAYILPDVVCDFTGVTLTQIGPDRVEVKGARGRAPTDQAKVSVTYADGFRAMSLFMIGGIDAGAKAQRVGAAMLARMRRHYAQRGWPDFTETCVEAIGAEDTYGPHARPDAREVMLKVGVRHPLKDALELFSREVAPLALMSAPAITGFTGGRPKVQPVVRLFSCLVPKAKVVASIDMGEQTVPAPQWSGQPFNPASLPTVTGPLTAASAFARGMRPVPLVKLAWGRSGDKGDAANIGIIARRPEYLPFIRAALTEQAVADWFAHLVKGKVERFDLPGTHALNFLLQEALGGGGIASIRMDPQAKAYAQMLLDFPVPIPAEMAI